MCSRTVVKRWEQGRLTLSKSLLQEPHAIRKTDATPAQSSHDVTEGLSTETWEPEESSRHLCPSKAALSPKEVPLGRRRTAAKSYHDTRRATRQQRLLLDLLSLFMPGWTCTTRVPVGHPSVRWSTICTRICTKYSVQHSSFCPLSRGTVHTIHVLS